MQNKKIFALILTILLVFSSFSPVFAQENSTTPFPTASDQQVEDPSVSADQAEGESFVDTEISQDQDTDQQQVPTPNQDQEDVETPLPNTQEEAILFLAEQLSVEEEQALSTAMNKINQAQTRTDVYKALDELQPVGWDKLTGSAKQANAPDMFLYLLKEKYNTPYEDVQVFYGDLKKALAIGYICDRNYYDSPLSLYVEFYRSINPTGLEKTFQEMTKEQQLVIAAALRALPGAKMSSSGNYISWFFEYDDSSAKHSEYEKYAKGPSGKYDDGHDGMFSSITAATDNTEQCPLIEKKSGQKPDSYLLPGKTYMFKELPSPAEGEKRIYFTSHMDKVSVHKDGYFDLEDYSVNNEVTLGYLDYDQETFKVSSYATYSNYIDDGKPYTEKIFNLEAGNIGAVYLQFNRELYNELKKPEIANKDTLINQVTLIKNGEVEGSTIPVNEIKWISERNLKINIGRSDMAVGDQLKVSFKNVSIRDGIEVSFETVTSKPVIADTISPVGKIITPKPGAIQQVKIIFSEDMHTDTKKIAVNEFVDQLWIVSQPDAKATDIPVDLTGSTAEWSIDADGRSIADITLDTQVQIGQGQHLKATYKDNVKDLAGNLINTSPTVIPIGGGLTIGRDDIYEAIRVAAGGRTPTIFIAGSSSENRAIAEENYNDPTGAQSGFAFASHGFEPVFMPIAVDNYTNAAELSTNIEIADSALAAFFCGGDQLKHARSFLKDDGSDSPLMTAVRQIYTSGGVLTGSSAGDHVMSDLQCTNSASWESIMKNDPKTISTKEYREADDNSVYFVTRGFGFAKAYGMTDSHFSERGRLGRLVVGLHASKQNMGIGVDENTAIVLRDGIGQVIGENTVTLADISNASINQLYSKHFNAQNVTVHLLSNGDTFDFRTNTLSTGKTAISESGTLAAPKKDIFADKQMRNAIENLVASEEKTFSDVSKDKGPVVTVTFRKAADTNAWSRSGTDKDGKYTVVNLLMDITDDSEKAVPPTSGSKGRGSSSKTPIVDQPKEETPTAPLPEAPVTPSLSDIQNHWAKDAIKVLVDRGLFKGVDNNKFAPDTAMTRAMFTTVLSRFAEENIAPYSSSRFTDVAPGQWYTEAVEWAADRQIVNGTGQGTFQPNASITREQMAVILYKYLQDKGIQLSQSTDLTAFSDEATVSSWAKEAVSAMQQAEIISGKPGNIFDPQGTATRAEACAMFNRLITLTDNQK